MRELAELRIQDFPIPDSVCPKALLAELRVRHGPLYPMKKEPGYVGKEAKAAAARMIAGRMQDVDTFFNTLCGAQVVELITAMGATPGSLSNRSVRGLDKDRCECCRTEVTRRWHVRFRGGLEVPFQRAAIFKMLDEPSTEGVDLKALRVNEAEIKGRG